MSKAAKIFIDGAAGTTGLEIRERLAGRSELSLIALSDAERKDQGARKRALNEADLVVLCLPDEAARESVSLIDNPQTRVIDASTAHRVAEGWDFGFPELDPDGYNRIAASKRVSNPGCWATGFLAIARPLVRAGIIPKDFPLTANGVSGYSGGGKSMIAEFEDKNGADYTETVSRIYGLALTHKHIPEMQKHSGLSHPPLFEPSVGRYYRGMLVEVPLQLWALPATPTPRNVHAALVKAYPDRPLVKVASLEDAAAAKTLDAEIFAGTNGLTIYVFANEKTEQARVVAAFDNLGKGASGAAVQNMNIMLGLPETTGL
ncbi:MAG TPA: N-acetyl-gamma-glutamyl-phosphate reductase [Rhizomicrobium sp.]|jgi:N-acetyl-gamma-glutamyl-phosphate reductase|nr:N-acetyl-gamma-glutamyl-phosphate reductase [Rhizomicrobium sp.]